MSPLEPPYSIPPSSSPHHRLQNEPRIDPEDPETRHQQHLIAYQWHLSQICNISANSFPIGLILDSPYSTHIKVSIGPTFIKIGPVLPSQSLDFTDLTQLSLNPSTSQFVLLSHSILIQITSFLIRIEALYKFYQ